MLIFTPDGVVKYSRYKIRALATYRSKSLEAIPRSTRNTLIFSSELVDSVFNQSVNRALISRAAFLVKVIANISDGFAPSNSALMILDVNNQVFPEPAHASTITSLRGSNIDALSSKPLIIGGAMTPLFGTHSLRHNIDMR